MLKLDHLININDPLNFVLIRILATSKEYILQFTFGQNLGWEPLCSINLRDLSIFFNIWQHVFFCPRYLGLMVVSQRTLGVLSEKHNFGKGYPRWNLKINDENWFYCGFGQWFLVWQPKWYSETVIFWKMSTQAITITTRFCPQSYM